MIEVLVKVGDVVKAEDALVTLESDKATMDVPAPLSGTVDGAQRQGRRQGVGRHGRADAVDGRGHRRSGRRRPRWPRRPQRRAQRAAATPRERSRRGAIVGNAAAPASAHRRSRVRARLRRPRRAQARARARRRSRQRQGQRRQGPHPARKTSRRSRRAALHRRASAAAPAAAGAPAAASTCCRGRRSTSRSSARSNRKPLSRIKKISGANLHRNWVMIPHVTQSRRRRHHRSRGVSRAAEQGEREERRQASSMLAFMIKAACATLQKFPEFNASLDGDNLVLKKYFHIGFAADTPNGLVVPVIRDADKKGVSRSRRRWASSRSSRATASSSPTRCRAARSRSRASAASAASTSRRSSTRRKSRSWACAARSGSRCRRRQDVRPGAYVLPLSLSWDHRVIDGAAAARFNAHFAALLADMRRVLV